jgi:2-keto-4-pentenoate hydratase
MPVIEVVDTRLTNPDAAGDLWKLADNQSNGGLVFGDPVAGWSGQPLDAADIELTVGGKTEYSGLHSVPGGDALDIFCAFAAIIGDHCGGLVPGHIVTTGSLMGCLYIEPGQSVRGTISGLGRVEVGFS